MADRLNELFGDIAPDAPPFSEADMKRFAHLFPGLDLAVEVESVAAWLPTAKRVPTKSPYRFLLNWLAKAARQQKEATQARDREARQHRQAVAATEAQMAAHTRGTPATPEGNADARKRLAKIFGRSG